MSVDGMLSAEVQDLVARASTLMIEALALLDCAAADHAAALLDNAIAILPKHDASHEGKNIPATEESDVAQSDNRSSIRL